MIVAEFIMVWLDRMKSSPDSVSWLSPDAGPGPGRVAVAIFPSGLPVEKENEGSAACDASRGKALKAKVKARATVLAKSPLRKQSFSELGFSQWNSFVRSGE